MRGKDGVVARADAASPPGSTPPPPPERALWMPMSLSRTPLRRGRGREGPSRESRAPPSARGRFARDGWVLFARFLHM